MKRVIAIVTLMLIVALPAFAQDAKPVKVGVINMQKVMAESKIGKQSTDRISEFVKQKEAEIQQDYNLLRTDAAQLESQRSVLSAEAVQSKANELQKRELELKQKSTDTQRQLQTMQNEELQKFFKIAKPVIDEIGLEKGFTIVLDHPSRTGQVLYIDKTIDITDEVIKRIDAASTK